MRAVVEPVSEHFVTLPPPSLTPRSRPPRVSRHLPKPRSSQVLAWNSPESLFGHPRRDPAMRRSGSGLETGRTHAALPEGADHAIAADSLEQEIEPEGGEEEDDHSNAQEGSR